MAEQAGVRRRPELACTQRFTRYQREWFASVRERAAAGEPVALLSADSPHEIYVVIQWWSSVIAAKQRAPRYLRALADAGYPDDCEQYNSLPFGGLLSADDDPPWGGLPRPAIVSASLNTDGTRQLFEAWAQRSGAVFYPIEKTVDPRDDLPEEWWAQLPRSWDRFLPRERLDLLTDELTGLIRVLEQTTGRRFSETRFAEVMHLANEQAEHNAAARDLVAATVPAPVSVAETMPAVMVPQWHRGSAWARDAAAGFRAERRPSPGSSRTGRCPPRNGGTMPTEDRPAAQEEPADGPLAGLRVIDLTRALAGPFCTLVLAGLGADVIKVEDPVGGDIARGNAPYLGADGLSLTRTGPDAMSLAVLNRCRGKRSITLDLKRPGAAQVFLDLVRQADIVVENFSSGTADRLGVGYAAAHAVNPAVIYCSISGFGADASSGVRAMDTIIQALSGVMLTSGAPGEPPVRVGVPLADVLTPVWAVVGILAALHRRAAREAGEHVDVSMLGTLTSLVATEDWSAMEQLGQALRTGPTLPRLAPFGIYRCADGWAAIVAPQDKLVTDLFAVMDRQDLLADPRFASRDARVRHEGEPTRQIERWTGARPTADVVARLSAAGVPAAPVRSPQQAVADQRVIEREETLPVEHPTLGQSAGLRTSGIPFRLASARVGFTGPAPRLGEHTAQVLTEIAGYTAGQQAALRQAGVIGEEPPLEP